MNFAIDQFNETMNGNLVRNEGVVVTNKGFEIMCFDNKKSAGAFIQQVYLLKPYEAKEHGILISSLKDRQPKSGDVVFYDGLGKFGSVGIEKDEPGARGVIQTFHDRMQICFRASAYRNKDSVDCSGGPLPFINPESLTLIGLKEQVFWNWHDGNVGAGQAGYYKMIVPLWRWNGTCS